MLRLGRYDRLPVKRIRFVIGQKTGLICQSILTNTPHKHCVPFV